MSRSVLTVSWYRARATFGQRRSGYLAIALLVGLVGGLAMASVAAARRTQSSFPDLVASSDPSGLAAFTAVLNPLVPGSSGYNADLVERIRQLPHVTQVRSEVGVDVLALNAKGAPYELADFPPAAGNAIGSVDGYGFDQDRYAVVQGRLPDPGRTDQIAMAEPVAAAAKAHVGQRFRLGVYTNAQTNLPAFGTAAVAPYRTIVATLVGIVVAPHQVVEDDVDNSQSLVVLTPAFTRPLISCCVNYTVTGIQISGGSRNLAAVDSAVRRVGIQLAPDPIPSADTLAKAERAIKPESIALGIFGAISALAALLIAIQLIGRQRRRATQDLVVLRALGADPAMTAFDGLIGTVGGVVLGSFLAVIVAVALSPLAPLGPVRPVYPYPGLSYDWTVLGAGALALMLVLCGAAVAVALRSAPQRAGRRRWVPGAPSAAAGRAAAAGFPAPAVTGMHFALDPGVGDSVPVRSAILGTTLAVVVLVSTIIFGSSLDKLVSHPALYGWNWDYALAAGGGSGDIPQKQVTSLLNSDRYVTAWSGAYFTDLGIDALQIPVMGERPGTALQPPVLSGHDLQGDNQIVLGAGTLDLLHKKLGDLVTVTGTGLAPARLQIVGTATMPTIGGPGPHLEMDTGAVLPQRFIPATGRNPFKDPVTGPETIFVDVTGAPPTALPPPSDSGQGPAPGNSPAVRSLNRIAAATTNNFNFGVQVGTVLRPAEIVNYRTLGTTPAVLGGALALGAAAALALTLLASVRRRRRDLALLKTLGFTARQLAATIAWQSSIAVGLGMALGIPVGIAIGRALWNLFANDIHAVPSPSVPASYLVAVAVGALVLANAVAAIPGRMAARTPTALLLRAG